MSRAMPSAPIVAPVASRNGLFVTDRMWLPEPKAPLISYASGVSRSMTPASRRAISSATSGSSSLFVWPRISRPGCPMRRAAALLTSR